MKTSRTKETRESDPSSLPPFGRGHPNRSGVPVMTRLHQCTVRQLCRLRMVVWALDAVSADAEHCCPALLTTRVIAGHGATYAVIAAEVDRAPWIRIRR